MEQLKSMMAPKPAEHSMMLTGHPMSQGMGGEGGMSIDEMLDNPEYNNLEGMGPMQPQLPQMQEVPQTYPNDPSTLTVEGKAKLEKPVKSLDDVKEVYQGMSEDPRVTERLNRHKLEHVRQGSMKATPAEMQQRMMPERPKKPTLEERYRR